MTDSFSWHQRPYQRFIPEPQRAQLWADAEPVSAVPTLRIAAGLRARFPRTLTDDALGLLATVYDEVRFELQTVLLQREVDRAFIDQQTLALRAANAGASIEDPGYRTAIGAADAGGAVPFGPAPHPPRCPTWRSPRGWRAPRSPSSARPTPRRWRSISASRWSCKLRTSAQNSCCFVATPKAHRTRRRHLACTTCSYTCDGRQQSTHAFGIAGKNIRIARFAAG